jgi:hypothetical protein
MDAHVHGGITSGLRERGIDVLTAQEDQLDRAPDSELFDRATALGRVMITYDKDFLAEAHRRQSSGIEFTDVVFSQERDVRTGRWINELELIAMCLEPDEIRGRVEYLPLK